MTVDFLQLTGDDGNAVKPVGETTRWIDIDPISKYAISGQALLAPTPTHVTTTYPNEAAVP